MKTLEALKQFCTLDEYSDTLDWYALADACEEERYDNAADIIRGLIISHMKFRKEKNYWPFLHHGFYYWTAEGNENNQSLIPQEIFNRLKYPALSNYPVPYKTKRAAYRSLFIAYLEAYHELY